MVDPSVISSIKSNIINHFNFIINDDDIIKYCGEQGQADGNYITFARFFYRNLIQVFFDMGPTFAKKEYGYYKNYKAHMYADTSSSIVEFYNDLPKEIFTYIQVDGTKREFLTYDERLRMCLNYLEFKHHNIRMMMSIERRYEHE